MVDGALPLTVEEVGALNADIRRVLEAWNTKAVERGFTEGGAPGAVGPRGASAVPPRGSAWLLKQRDAVPGAC